MKKPLVLCILDGCGMRKDNDGNAFLNAEKPTFDLLWEKYPHCLLNASGIAVGLPPSQMGNSEVGHMTLGAGRIVYQPLELINKAIDDGSFFKNQEIHKIISHVKENNSKLHIMGLLSDGGVHSHINHLFACIDLIKEQGFKNVYFHIFTDGRDTNSKSAYKYIEKLQHKIEEVGFGKIVTICGRYYAMDRDNHYDRLKKAYDAIVYGIGEHYNNSKDVIDSNYKKNITDEFIIPAVLNEGKVEDGDAIITFNFRRDRLRELFTAFTNPKESPFGAKEFKNLKVLTFMPVVESVKCPHAFDNPDLTDTMGKYLCKNNLTQLRIAETEKYAHVTYFFDGGVEEKFDGMKKILIPSPQVATYDLEPKMSADKVTDTLIEELNKDYLDVIILNYANGDMVGHTGNYDAAKEAIEFLDICLNRVYNKVKEKDGVLIIIADHGNCEVMWDKNHVPVTSHSTNPVPFIITKKDLILSDGSLADVAPTMLDILGLKKPEAMTGKSLISLK